MLATILPFEWSQARVFCRQPRTQSSASCDFLDGAEAAAWWQPSVWGRLLRRSRLLPSSAADISPHTAHLLWLLERWPRRGLSHWLLEVSQDAATQLHERQWPKHLKRRANRQKLFVAPEKRSGIGVIGYTDETYPPLLRQIPDPPLVLFCKGSIAALNSPSIAVIGARRCTTQGRVLAQEMAASLASQQICIVSGLALGIDTAAHVGALAQNGVTVAFLGCGLDRTYPRANQRLAAQIIETGGAVVSEYPPHTPPLAHHFPERNRLISGAAAAVVVVEASDKSGSLITARMALEQGRDVLAMPGPANSEVSGGCHRLIQQGAGLVTNAEDVLLELPTLLKRSRLTATATTESVSATHLSADASAVLQQLTAYAHSLDEIAAAMARNPQEISLALVELELGGFVTQGADGYIRASKI